jgi:serine/threonine protein kinase/tetratricopeptide (TPR) repeat protein
MSDEHDEGAVALAPGVLTALLEEIAAEPEPREPDPAGLPAGCVIDRFEIVRELGRGGFGVVYEARDRELLRSVAFKLVRPGKAAGTGEAQLAREAEAIARLSHPNIVTLYDVGRSEHGPYLVFELLRGTTLQERLGDGALPMAEAIRIAIDVARGLAAAHADGVVHRDLKPSNVMLCERGSAKILDFGMAHAFGRKRVNGGTPAYMAPEQWQDAPEDERTDVFALGALLYRMLSGELPSGDRDGPWPEGPGIAPSLEIPTAPALAELVERMLEPSPVKRPRDAGVVLEALERLQGDLAPAPPDVVIRPVPTRRPTPRRTGASPGPSVAVLPFADLSAERDQEYFADGIAEEILNALAHVPGLRVIGRTSSFSFKGKDATLAEIGRELRVGTVLEGSVRKDGARVRITAQLARAADEASIWSQTFDRELTGIFAVQDEIAKAVVGALKLKLLARTGVDRRTDNAQAHDHQLAGQQFLARGTLDGFRRAVSAFESAIALDPRYASAHAGLANALVWLWRLGAERLPGFADVERRARAAAEQATAVGPGLPGSFEARARVRLADWDWAGARSDVDEALALSPRSPWGLRLKAALLSVNGRRSEAIAVTREAIEADPLNAFAWASLGWYQLDAGDAALAHGALARALEISPELDAAAAMLMVAFLVDGRPADAMAVSQRCGDERFRLMGVALAQHDLGHPREAREALDAFTSRFGRDLPYRVAEVHAWRGEADDAFGWLDRARAQRDAALCDVRDDPLLKSLRGDARYAALLRDMSLPVEGR